MGVVNGGDDFFRRGTMIDFLNDVGNVGPRDMLTMLEIDGSSKWRC